MCTDLMGNVVAMTAEWYYRKKNENNLLASIVLGCGDAEMARLYTQWDILWLSTAGAPIASNQHVSYPTGLNTNYFVVSQCAELFIDILNKYNWTSVTVVTDPSSPPFYAVLMSVFLVNLKGQRHITHSVREINAKLGRPFGGFGSILDDIRASSRVVIYFGIGKILREFLVTAASLNMTNGEYVYILTENNLFRPFHWKAGDKDDLIITN
ncbi:uncharacterized protein LOC129585274 [Paramacrobiotus metropolitanus]|uniref:uncharacterized protein LOC129585274 n=1 Tax=Paramacrobiotus metropolitanus TaxID=2943436 RepID=UPI0024463E8F|nr:uncharacterized protein LOC129585274 [Paramacrobiotus metropolitanus]